MLKIPKLLGLEWYTDGHLTSTYLKDSEKEEVSELGEAEKKMLI